MPQRVRHRYTSPNPKGFRLTESDRLHILRLHRTRPDLSTEQIAKACKVSRETARNLIRAYELQDRELIRAAMASRTPEMLESWAAAARTGARYGKHSPARDWLLHSGAIEPLVQQPQLAVAVVNVGLPGIDAAIYGVMQPTPATQPSIGPISTGQNSPIGPSGSRTATLPEAPQSQVLPGTGWLSRDAQDDDSE
jgi:hypothetical protein